jgi:hypothetical protein
MILEWFKNVYRGRPTSNSLTGHREHLIWTPTRICGLRFNCLVYIKKYADIGTRINIVSFRRLLLARVQLPGLHKEICRYWDSNQHSIFPKNTASTRQLPGLHKEICHYWDLNQRSLFPKVTASTRSTAWVTPADSKKGTVRSPYPSLAAQLASCLGKLMKFN